MSDEHETLHGDGFPVSMMNQPVYTIEELEAIRHAAEEIARTASTSIGVSIQGADHGSPLLQEQAAHIQAEFAELHRVMLGNFE